MATTTLAAPPLPLSAEGVSSAASVGGVACTGRVVLVVAGEVVEVGG